MLQHVLVLQKATFGTCPDGVNYGVNSVKETNDTYYNEEKGLGRLNLKSELKGVK